MLMISCHVSLNPKIGPEIPQTATTATATRNAMAWPALFDTDEANRWNAWLVREA